LSSTTGTGRALGGRGAGRAFALTTLLPLQINFASDFTFIRIPRRLPWLTRNYDLIRNSFSMNRAWALPMMCMGVNGKGRPFFGSILIGRLPRSLRKRKHYYASFKAREKTFALEKLCIASTCGC